jgi:hypothetical protein
MLVAVIWTYRVLQVLEIQPDSEFGAICVIDTDLSVDFAPVQMLRTPLLDAGNADSFWYRRCEI